MSRVTWSQVRTSCRGPDLRARASYGANFASGNESSALSLDGGTWILLLG